MALFSMVVTSVTGMGELVGEKRLLKIKNSTIIYGSSAVVAGVFPAIGYMPYVSSTGVIAMTRVASRKPFLFGCLFVMALGLLRRLGHFLFHASGSGVCCDAGDIFIDFWSGTQRISAHSTGNRENFVIGISIMIGVGVMFLPNTAF